MSIEAEVRTLELAIKGILFEASDEEVQKYTKSRRQIEKILEENGDMARLALSLIGAKLAI